MAESIKVYVNGDEIMTARASLDPKAVQDLLSEDMPDVANATYHVDSDGNIYFEHRTGTKG